MTFLIPLATQIPTSFTPGEALGHDIVQMIIHAGPVVKMVLLILLMFSVISWTITFTKFRLLRKAKRETASFLNLFWESADLKKIFGMSENLRYSPVARLFRAGYLEFNRIQKIQASSNLRSGEQNPTGAASSGPQQAVMDNLDRSLKRAIIDQMNRLERAVNFLATTGNTAPFIGLFGTVWGIMESFRGIGLRGSANLAVVAPGISEALIATAAGLAAAIPAVVAFNYFTHKISDFRAEMDIFQSDFLSMVERQLFRKQMVSRREGP
jgi:biopolymer transport protein TolQ